MCGISVIVALEGNTHDLSKQPNGVYPDGVDGVDIHEDKNAAKLARELDESLDMIVHRGPDSRGQWISDDKRVGPRPPVVSFVHVL